jgi:hypothetical protein
MTDQERALVILDRLVELETERALMADLLNHARVPESGLPLEWRPMVQASRNQTLRDSVSAKYTDIRRSIEDSTPQCPGALSLLEPALKGQAEIDNL